MPSAVSHKYLQIFYEISGLHIQRILQQTAKIITQKSHFLQKLKFKHTALLKALREKSAEIPLNNWEYKGICKGI